MRLILLIYILLFQNSIDKPVKVTINPDKDKESDFLLSEYAKTVKYIKLQTTDACMVSDVIKVLMDEDYIFLCTRYGQYSRLLEFKENGNFKCEIGTQGRAPGEYSTVLDFTLDKAKKIIYILDTMGKILYFDYTGKYLGKIEVNSRPTNLLIWREALVLFTAWPDYYLNKGYGVQIKHLTKKSDIYLLNRNWVKGQRVPGVMIYPNYFYGVNSNSISFLEAKFDTLYRIDNNFNIKAKMVIDLVNNMPYNLLTQNEYHESHKSHNSLFDIIEANNYVFFTVMTAKPVTTYFYIINKSSLDKKKHNVSMDKQYFINDIDGGLTFRPIGLADDGVLYSSIDCYKLNDYLNSGHSRNNMSISPEKRENLVNLVNRSKISDNPILMFVELK